MPTHLSRLILNVNVVTCHFFHKAFPSLHSGNDESLPCIRLWPHQQHGLPSAVYMSAFPRRKWSFLKGRLSTLSYFRSVAPSPAPGLTGLREVVLVTDTTRKESTSPHPLEKDTKNICKGEGSRKTGDTGMILHCKSPCSHM